MSLQILVNAYAAFGCESGLRHECGESTTGNIRKGCEKLDSSSRIWLPRCCRLSGDSIVTNPDRTRLCGGVTTERTVLNPVGIITFSLSGEDKDGARGGFGKKNERVA